MPELLEAWTATREALIGYLQAAWPDLVKVHKTKAELASTAYPYGWVIQADSMKRVGENSTRNTDCWMATFSIGGRFAKPKALNVDDERVRLVALLYDQLSSSVHPGDYAYLPVITELLSDAGESEGTYFDVDLMLTVCFDSRRADAV